MLVQPCSTCPRGCTTNTVLYYTGAWQKCTQTTRAYTVQVIPVKLYSTVLSSNNRVSCMPEKGFRSIHPNFCLCRLRRRWPIIRRLAWTTETPLLARPLERITAKVSLRFSLLRNPPISSHTNAPYIQYPPQTLTQASLVCHFAPSEKGWQGILRASQVPIRQSPSQTRIAFAASCLD